MKIINANGFSIHPGIVVAAHTEGITKVVAHPAQLLSWELCAILNNGFEYDPEKFPDIPQTKLTCAGYPARADDSLPIGTVDFRNDSDETLSRIEALAIPHQWQQLIQL